MDHFLLNKPIDLATAEADLEYLKEQISVATALRASPIILTHMVRQLEANAHDLLNYDALPDSPELAKSKLITKQAAVAATAYYIRVANSLEAMVEHLHQATTNQDPQE